MNLLRFELQRRFTSLLWWIVGLGSLQLIMLSFFPIMAREQEVMDLILKYYPPELLAAFGLANATTLGEITGYLVFSFIFAQVALAIHASIEGFSILTIEESENFADFLLTKPISRRHIYVMKSLSMIIVMSILSVATIVFTLIGIVWFAPDTTISNSMMLLFVSLFPLQALFYITALTISQGLTSLRSPTTLAMGLGFGMYMLYALRGALDYDILRYINFYNYVDIATILNQEPLDWVLVGLGLIMVFGGLFVSYNAYLRRNITSK